VENIKEETSEIEEVNSGNRPIKLLKRKRKSFKFGSAEQRAKPRQSHLLDVLVKASAKNRKNIESLDRNRTVINWLKKHKERRHMRDFSNLKENQLSLIGDKSFIMTSIQEKVLL
jgi:hypothetical protein